MTSMATQSALETLEDLLLEARPYLIVSPPRSASTALGRSLRNHSQIGLYIHEPCDRFRHENAGVASVVEELTQNGLIRGTLIKEMTFQLGSEELCELFLQSAQHPIVFLVRHPRRSLESRIRMVLKDLANEDPELRHRIDPAVEKKDYRGLGELVDEERFPLEFTGWMDLEKQIQTCREKEIEYRIIVAGDFRSNPRACLEPLLASWGLEFEEAMVDWSQSASFRVGGLDEQSAWYKKVEQSRGVLPEDSDILPIERFPIRFHEHVLESEQFFQTLLVDPRRLEGGS